MIIKNVEKLPLKCCLVSSFFSHSIVHLATCTQTPRLIINFVPRPLSLCTSKCLELPLNLLMFEAKKDGAVSIELQTSTTKKVEDQLEKKTENTKLKNVRESIVEEYFWMARLSRRQRGR